MKLLLRKYTTIIRVHAVLSNQIVELMVVE